MMYAKESRLTLIAAMTALALVVGLEQDASAQQASDQQTDDQQTDDQVTGDQITGDQITGDQITGDQQTGESVVDPFDVGASAPTTTAGDTWGARNSSRSSRDRRTRRTRRTRRNRRTNRRRGPREVTATVDVAAGPSFFAFGNPLQGDQVLSGPIFEDQPIHYGLRFDAAAIIDYEFYKENRDLVPSQYRGMFKPDTEIRYAPAAVALIPRNLYISPKTNNTGVYGATWELMGIGLTLLKSSSTKLSAGAGLLATYAYIDSDVFESTHFLRPGVSLGLNLGTMFNDKVGMSIGWDSNFYLPQDIGGGIMEGGGEDALWHIGEGFLMFHYRFPYTTTI